MFGGSVLPYLAGLINHSIATFSLTEGLRLAEIMSTCHKDDSLDKENYRPLRLLYLGNI